MSDVLFAGNETDAFATVIQASDVNGVYDNAWVHSSIRFSSTSYANSYLTTPSLGGVSVAWAHFELWPDHGWGSSSVTFFEIRNSSGTPVVQLRSDGHIFYLYYSIDGTTWTQIGNPWPPLTQTYRFDVRYELNGANSIIEVYVGGSIAITGTGDFTGTGNCDTVWFRSGSDGYDSSGDISQIIVASKTTINYRYSSTMPTSNGADQNWSTPAYTNVAKTTVNDATFISSPTANQTNSFKAPARAWAATAYTVKSVFVSGRGRRDAAGPTASAGLLRIGGTDYAGDSSALTFGFDGFVHRFDTDPSTGIAWDTAAAGAATLEFGLKSIAA